MNLAGFAGGCACAHEWGPEHKTTFIDAAKRRSVMAFCTCRICGVHRMMPATMATPIRTDDNAERRT